MGFARPEHDPDAVIVGERFGDLAERGKTSAPRQLGEIIVRSPTDMTSAGSSDRNGASWYWSICRWENPSPPQVIRNDPTTSPPAVAYRFQLRQYAERSKRTEHGGDHHHTHTHTPAAC